MWGTLIAHKDLLLYQRGVSPQHFISATLRRQFFGHIRGVMHYNTSCIMSLTTSMGSIRCSSRRKVSPVVASLFYRWVTTFPGVSPCLLFMVMAHLVRVSRCFKHRNGDASGPSPLTSRSMI